MAVNMQEKYCIAIDLDGTALESLRVLHPDSVGALKAANKNGHHVVIATARPWCLTAQHYQTLGLDTPVILCNGADYRAAGDFPSAKYYLSEAQMKSIFAILPHELLDQVWIEQNDILLESGEHPGSEYFDELTALSEVGHISIDHIPMEESSRVLVWLNEDHRFSSIVKALEQVSGIDVFWRKWQTGMVLFSFNSLKADKWFGVKAVAEHFGVPQERIIAFGDEMNDLNMLKNSGLGYAMLNGNSELKRQVGRITALTNTQGGVGKELERLLQIQGLA